MKKIIKLGLPTCRPCLAVNNYLDEYGADYRDVDVSQNPEVAAIHDIASVPVTILLDEEGEEIMRSVGFNPEELDEILKKHEGDDN